MILSCILTISIIHGVQFLASAVTNRKPLSGITLALNTRTVRPAAPDTIPSFECAIDPFGRVPNWGDMRSAAQIGRAYTAIAPQEYVFPPAYNLPELQTPLSTLNQEPRSAEAERLLTEKLFYSTRFMGRFDLDDGEWTGTHPGIDFKMPPGSPIRAIAGGRVSAVRNQPEGLGKYVMIEHRLPTTSERIFSIYGHMDVITVAAGDAVRPGDDIGTVGETGDATLPHLHLQIGRDDGSEPHQPYVPTASATRSEVMKHLINPMDVIDRY